MEEAFIEFVESENFQLGETFYMGKDTKKGSWAVVAELLV